VILIGVYLANRKSKTTWKNYLLYPHLILLI
jgi:hypothetical protein